MPKTIEYLAKKLNSFCKRVGLALRMEFITPLEATEQLKANPALLKKHNLTQMMAGDSSDDAVVDAKGRPMVATLVDRILNGKWRWYFGLIARCANGAVVDGVSRLIAISRAGKPVWVLTYNDADPADFYMYDDEASARAPKDIFAGMGLPPEMSAVLSVVAPKVAGAVTGDDGSYNRVIRDKWYAYYKANRESVESCLRLCEARRGQGRNHSEESHRVHVLQVRVASVRTKRWAGFALPDDLQNRLWRLESC